MSLAEISRLEQGVEALRGKINHAVGTRRGVLILELGSARAALKEARKDHADQARRNNDLTRFGQSAA